MLRTNNRGVAAAFVKRQAAVNSSGQYYTDGETLYSYGIHWPVAAWVGGRLHINDDRYSTTTSKHRSFAISGVVREARWALDSAIYHPSLASMKAALRMRAA